MKNKCYILKNALLLALIAFLFGLSLLLIREWFDLTGNAILGYLYDLSAAFFACSLLVFILSIKDYLNARTDFMKDFWAEANTVNNELKKVNYIFMDIPNKYIVRDITKDTLNPKLQKYVYEHYKDPALDEGKEEELTDRIELIVSEEREKLLSSLKKEIKTYIELSKISLSKLNYIVNDAEFFRGDSTKENMHNYIYQPLYDVYKDIKSLASDIECGDLKDEESLLQVLNDIHDIQDKLFVETYDNNRIKISSGLPAKIERALETWRSTIYHDMPIYDEPVTIKVVTPKVSEDKLRNSKTEEETDEEELEVLDTVE